MCADGFDYKVAAGLHRDRLNEAESIRRAKAAKKAAGNTEKLKFVLHRKTPAQGAAASIKKRIGKQLIALGERLSA